MEEWSKEQKKTLARKRISIELMLSNKLQDLYKSTMKLMPINKERKNKESNKSKITLNYSLINKMKRKIN